MLGVTGRLGADNVDISCEALPNHVVQSAENVSDATPPASLGIAVASAGKKAQLIELAKGCPIGGVQMAPRL